MKAIMDRYEWKKNTSEEITFWKRYYTLGTMSPAEVLKSADLPLVVRFKDELPDFAAHLKAMSNKDSVLTPLVAQFLTPRNNSVLDVGAGPISVLGIKSPEGYPINLKPIDALADEYQQMLVNIGITPPCPSIQCDFENITQTFPEGTFDVAFSKNALDHGYDPFRALQGMFCVTKDGGHIILIFFENEGKQSSYHGLHKWNFYLDQKCLWMSDAQKNHTKNLTEVFSPIASQVVACHPDYQKMWEQGICEEITNFDPSMGWIVAIFRKNPDE
jgi:ubiquinone/menaquinone biosynthesis C-methylase UbiE